MKTSENNQKKRRKRIGAIGASKVVKEIGKLAMELDRLYKNSVDGTDTTAEHK